jgi:hypothetical protein
MHTVRVEVDDTSAADALWQLLQGQVPGGEDHLPAIGAAVVAARTGQSWRFEYNAPLNQWLVLQGT